MNSFPDKEFQRVLEWPILNHPMSKGWRHKYVKSGHCNQQFNQGAVSSEIHRPQSDHSRWRFFLKKLNFRGAWKGKKKRSKLKFETTTTSCWLSSASTNWIRCVCVVCVCGVCVWCVCVWGGIKTDTPECGWMDRHSDEWNGQTDRQADVNLLLCAILHCRR